ncbi:uncharacterized protein isoform X2 [Leptinotarsa decemlineata]|uniref:uncharacterized protein isoform X2 n=1 Tax=Leptinotarsa decemlineata TaxID=7539 RepID=UPI003D308FCF
MKAVKFIAKEQRIELVEVPIPEIKQSYDVLIKVAYSGICGTDLHIIEGNFPCVDSEPLTLGHEFSGNVFEVGTGVTNLKKGDNVVVDPNNSCKCCKFCQSGRPQFCTGTNENLGTFRNGAFAEYILVPVHMVHKLPDIITLQQDTGFTLLKPEELESKRKDQHYLFDVIIDCSGYAQAIEHAISFLQRGGKICCFGVAPPDATIRVKPFDIFMNELKIYGVKVNPFSFPKALGLLESMGDRYLNYDCLGIKIFELKDYKVALDQLKKGIILKAMFKF